MAQIQTKREGETGLVYGHIQAVKREGRERGDMSTGSQIGRKVGDMSTGSQIGRTGKRICLQAVRLVGRWGGLIYKKSN